MKLFFAILISLVFCIDSFGQNTFDEVYNILQNKCVSCHSGITPAGQLDFSEISSVVHSNIVEGLPTNPEALAKGHKLIDAGYPEKSFLLRKISNPIWDNYYSIEVSEGSLMPPYGSTQLTFSEIEIIRQWILHGAPENGNVVNTQTINDFYNGMGLPRIQSLAKPDPNEGFQLRFGPIILGPNEEIEYRLLHDLNLGNEIEVNRLKLEMNNESHHFILYENDGDLDDGLREVSNFFDILDGKFLQGWQDDFDVQFPNGTAFAWDSEIELDLNYHVRNYNSDSVLLAEAYINVYTQPSGTAEKIMHATLNTYNPFALNMPANQISIFEDYDINEIGSQFYDELDLTQPEPLYIYMLTSHTHQLGSDYDMYKREIDGSQGNQIFEGFYNNDYTFNQGYYDWEHPPVRYFDPPLEILPGEGIIHKAEFNNWTNNTVSFGLTTQDEMMLYYCLFTVGSPVDLEENKTSSNLQVYPNPIVNNDITISSEKEIIDLKIISSVGKTLKTYDSINNKKLNIHLDKGIPSGLYFIKASTREGTETKKILIQ